MVGLINGSEPVSMASIERFNNTFAPCGLPATAVKPSYGMAEATLFVSTIDPQAGATVVYLNSELYLIGRIKDLVIIDGRNHYPQDIEATVAESSSAVRAGYVTAFSVPGDEDDRAGERLVIVAERAPGTGKADPGPIIDAIRGAVSRRHALAVADVQLVAAGTIPRTTSGKLARRECRAKHLAGALDAR